MEATKCWWGLMSKSWDVELKLNLIGLWEQVVFVPVPTVLIAPWSSLNDFAAACPWVLGSSLACK